MRIITDQLCMWTGGSIQIYCANFQGLVELFTWKLQLEIPFISMIDILHQLGVKLSTFL